MKITVKLQIEVPDGSTHFAGSLKDEPCFYKCTQVGGFDHWWFYASETENWFLSGHSEPNFLKKIEDFLL